MAARPLAGAKWSVVNGQLVPPVTGGSSRSATPPGPTCSSTSTPPSSSGSGYGVYFRSDGKSKISGYCFQFDPGVGNKFIVRKVVDRSGVRADRQVKFPAGFSIYDASSRDHHQRRRQPHRLQGRRRQLLDFNDTTFASGGAGLRSWGSSAVSFMSAKALAGGGVAGGTSGASKGDFAYAYASDKTAYGLVGWLAGDQAFVIQPLQ